MFKGDYISFLPKHKRTDLELITGIISGTMDEAGMVILFGSYARGDYVDFDSRKDFNINTTYQSDYDILILTHKVEKKIIESKISAITNRYYDKKGKEKKRLEQMGHTVHVTPLRIVHKDIEDFNREISDNHYFYVQIKNQGKIIFDKGIYKLSEPRELDYMEIQVLAQEYHNFHYKEIKNHLRVAELSFNEDIYNLAAYHLQQVLEHVYHSILLVFTTDSPKNHKLHELNISIFPYAPEVSGCFGSPNDDDKTKECFMLIDKAYIEGRYNPDYVITKEQLILSTDKIQQVVELAREANVKQIKKYGELFLEKK